MSNPNNNKLNNLESQLQQANWRGPVNCMACRCKNATEDNGGSCPESFDCKGAIWLSEHGYTEFINDKNLPMCPMFRPDYSRQKQFEAESDALRADNAGLTLQFERLLQYDSLYWLHDHITDIVLRNHPGNFLIKELEALRNLQTISIDVLDWLKKNGYGGTGHARCLEDALAAVKGAD